MAVPEPNPGTSHAIARAGWKTMRQKGIIS
jgi:hypothetical protein